jgi:hypothetical protein
LGIEAAGGEKQRTQIDPGGTKAMRKITKLQIFYVVSLLILATLFVLAIFKPFASGSNYTQVSRQSLLQTQDEWIFQFDVLNHEGLDVRYTIHFLFGGQDYQENFMVRDGGKFTYIHHIRKENAGSGNVDYKLYKENSSEPIEQGTYYLK